MYNQCGPLLSHMFLIFEDLPYMHNFQCPQAPNVPPHIMRDLLFYGLHSCWRGFVAEPWQKEQAKAHVLNEPVQIRQRLNARHQVYRLLHPHSGKMPHLLESPVPSLSNRTSGFCLLL
jgi:hypothetical protein